MRPKWAFVLFLFFLQTHLCWFWISFVFNNSIDNLTYFGIVYFGVEIKGGNKRVLSKQRLFRDGFNNGKKMQHSCLWVLLQKVARDF